eukprot:gene8524-4823_t
MSLPSTGKLDASSDSDDLDIPVKLAAELYQEVLHGSLDPYCRQYSFMLLQRAARAESTLYRERDDQDAAGVEGGFGAAGLEPSMGGGRTYSAGGRSRGMGGASAGTAAMASGLLGGTRMGSLKIRLPMKRKAEGESPSPRPTASVQARRVKVVPWRRKLSRGAAPTLHPRRRGGPALSEAPPRDPRLSMLSNDLSFLLGDAPKTQPP